MSAAAAEAILTALGRKVLQVKGDGNCLFRALGYYFYGTEMMHCKTRTLLSDFVTANSDRFKSIVMGGDVMNHVQKMQHLSVWGTHIELQATASLFQDPVYMLTFSRQQNRYIWHCYQPRDSSKLKFPETEPPPTHLSNLDHVELLHVRACHFDVILHEEVRFSLDRPVLETARLFIKLD